MLFVDRRATLTSQFVTYQPRQEIVITYLVLRSGRRGTNPRFRTGPDNSQLDRTRSLSATTPLGLTRTARQHSYNQNMRPLLLALALASARGAAVKTRTAPRDAAAAFFHRHDGLGHKPPNPATSHAVALRGREPCPP